MVMFSKKGFVGNIDDILPQKLLDNSTFAGLKMDFFFNQAFRSKGIGPGEFALSLFGKDGKIVDHRGDVEIGGWGVEIKDGGGGSIKTGAPLKTRTADAAREWLGNQLGIEFSQKNKIRWDRPSELSEKLAALPQEQQQKLIDTYLEKLYPIMDVSKRQKLSSGILADYGSQEVMVHFGRALLSNYQEQDQWDSIAFIDKKGRIANIVDPESDAGLIDFNLAGLNRDGDTQAVPDGYVNGKIKNK